MVGAGALALCGEAEGLGLVPLAEEMAVEDLTAAAQCLQGGQQGDRAVVCGRRMTGGGHELK